MKSPDRNRPPAQRVGSTGSAALPPDERRKPGRLPVWIIIAVPLAAALCYLNSLDGLFVLDDRPVIENNRDVRPSEPLANLFRDDFWGTPIHSPLSHKSYRPFTILTFRLNYLAGGLEPFGYHLVNLLLHAGVSILVLLAARRVLGGIWAAGAAALLFAVHPVHTEAVASIVGRAELLCAAWCLLGFLAFARSVEGIKTRWGLLAAAAACTVLAALSKETGITLIGALFLYDWIVSSRGGLRPRAWAPFAERQVLMVSLGLAFLAMRLLLAGQWGLNFSPLDNPAVFAPAKERVLTFALAHAEYARLLLWPMSLSADYSYGAIAPVTSLADPRNLLAAALYAGLIAAFVFALRMPSRRPLFFALGWMVIAFLPVSHLFVNVPMLVAERALYLPSVCFCMALAWAFDRLRGSVVVQTKAGLWLAMGACGAVFIFWGVRTWLRNPDWHDRESLFASAIEARPNNMKAHMAVGRIHLKQKRYDEAMAHFDRALQIKPEYNDALHMKGRVFLETGSPEDAERLFRRAITDNPTNPDVHADLGVLLARQAAKELTDPSHSTEQKAGETSERLTEAIDHLERAVALDRTVATHYRNLGNAYGLVGRLDEAIRAYEAALRVDPSVPGGWLGIGLCRKAKDDLPGSRAALEQAALNPEDAERARAELNAMEGR